MRVGRPTYLALALVLMLLGSGSAHAQVDVSEAARTNVRINEQRNTPDMDDYVVSPTRFLLQMEPGDERLVELQLTNRTGEPTVYEFTTEDFVADPEQDGSPSFLSPSQSGPFPARQWIVPDVSSLTLEHAERAFIPLTIRVPEDAEPGDHQAAIIVRKRSTADSASGLRIVSRVASLFIITVPGDINREGEVTRFWTNRWLNWFLPADFYVTAHNTGNVHLNANGVVTIRNVFGVVVDEITISQWITLRESVRTKSVEWRPRFALGWYSATLNMVLAPELEPIEPMKVTFWVIPLLPVLILLLSIFLVSYLVQYFFSRFEIRKKD